MANENKDQQTLAGFGFDDEQTFFNIPGTGFEKESQTSTVVKEVKGQEINEEESGEVTNIDKEKPEPDAELEDDDFFPDPNKPKEEKPKVEAETSKETEKDKEKPKVEAETKPKEEGKTKDEDEDEKFYTTLALELKEKGTFSHVEIKEGDKIDEEKFFELQDAELEARLSDGFAEFAESMDDDGKDFIAFKRNGGKSADYINVVASAFALEEFDETDPKQVQKVLTHYIQKYEGITDAEELQDKLTWLKDGGKDKAYATKYFGIIKQKDKEAKDKLIEDQKQAKADSEKGAKEFETQLIATAKGTESVGIFSFSEADKKELPSYIHKPSIRVGKNKYVPEFSAKLAQILKAKTPEDQKKLLAIAKLVKADFQTEDLVTKTETKVVNKIKSKLKEAREQGVKPNSNAGTGNSQLADHF